MRSTYYILAVLLSVTNLGVFSAPIPGHEGDVVGYRDPKTVNDPNPRPHPAVIVGPEVNGHQDILKISHKLPLDEYPHQEPVANMGLGHLIAEGSISTLPTHADASKLKDKGKQVSHDVLQGLKAQMAECQSGTCHHVGGPSEVKGPVHQPEKEKAPAVPNHPIPKVEAIPVQHPPPQPKGVWGGEKGAAHKAGPPAKVNPAPVKVAAPPAKPQAHVNKNPADKKKKEKN